MYIRNEKDHELPLSSPTPLQKIGSKLDLNNADLIGCTVKSENEVPQRRFMVVDIYQEMIKNSLTMKNEKNKTLN